MKSRIADNEFSRYKEPGLPAPPLNSITEEQWNEFTTAVQDADWRRDTQSCLVMRVATDDRQALDVRKRALWRLGGGHYNDMLSYGIGQSSEPNEFVERSVQELAAAFSGNLDLAKYGAELGINFYESGDHSDDVLSHDASAAILLGAALNHVQEDKPLTSRVIKAMAGTKYGMHSTKRGIMPDTIGSAIIDPRVDRNNRSAILNNLLMQKSDYDQGHSLTNTKTALAIQYAIDKFIPEISEPDIIREYFKELADALNAGEITEGQYTGFTELPAGLERIDTLEQILGAEHSYLGQIIEFKVISSILSPEFKQSTENIKAAKGASSRIKDKDLRIRAIDAAGEMMADEHDKIDYLQKRRKAAQAAVNSFLSQSK